MIVKKITKHHIETDYVIYVDTDSIFQSALPLVYKDYPDISEDDIPNKVLEVSSQVQDYINNSYDYIAKKMFNTTEHRFEIKQEFVARAGFWSSKKRYAQNIILDNGVSVDDMDVKGLDIVRSSFPNAFRQVMTDVLWGILKGIPASEVDAIIFGFIDTIESVSIQDIAKGSAVKDIDTHDTNRGKELFSSSKGTPAHVKAALNYNDLLKYFKCGYKYSPIRSGDKIKWVYLKNNILHLEAIAFKDYEDPPEILEFIEKNVDRHKMYEKELKNKLEDFYQALKWHLPNRNNRNIEKFFEF